MSEIIGDNRKQLLQGDAVSHDKCISNAWTAQVETVCLLSKCDKMKKIEYREEEIPNCDCIYG